MFVKVFTTNRVSFKANLNPYTLKYLLKNRINDIHFHKAYIGGIQVKVGKGVRFYENPIIFGKVKIDRYVSINGPGTRICSNINRVKIGAFSSIASNVIIQEYYHNTQLVTTYGVLSNILRTSDTKIQVTSKGDIIIGEDVWIGSNVVILSGVKIGRGAVVGAGSVVTKDIEPYTINAGNPCKYIKDRFSKKSIEEIERSKWWEWTEDEMKKNEMFFRKYFS
ncbi:CatB-related O-acetyltransferase [Riemerella anatipestifer]|uniref:CatB-related O-acetyltransferase n=1 Tax=Riemerella anatipestifer TaxID=34085 RepID=UPI00288C225A|nr:CatB-related O-acetyltransferase [Riemerella anatipestifer]